MRSALSARRLSQLVAARRAHLQRKGAVRWNGRHASSAVIQGLGEEVDDNVTDIDRVRLNEEERLGVSPSDSSTTGPRQPRASAPVATAYAGSPAIPSSSGEVGVSHTRTPRQIAAAALNARISTLPRDATLSASLDHLLPSTDTGCALSPMALRILLARTADTASLIRLAPILTGSLSEIHDMTIFVRILARYMVLLGERRMMTVLPYLVDFFLRRMEEMQQLVRDGEASPDNLMTWYQTFIRGLRHFADPPHARHLNVSPNIPLPEPVRAHAARITRHLLRALDSLPSTSDPTKRPSLSHRFLRDTLCTPVFMSPDMLDMVLRHVQSRNAHVAHRRQQLTRNAWTVCYLQAAEVGSRAKMEICRQGIMWGGTKTERAYPPRITDEHASIAQEHTGIADESAHMGSAVFGDAESNVNSLAGDVPNGNELSMANLHRAGEGSGFQLERPGEMTRTADVTMSGNGDVVSVSAIRHPESSRLDIGLDRAAHSTETSTWAARLESDLEAMGVPHDPTEPKLHSVPARPETSQHPTSARAARQQLYAGSPSQVAREQLSKLLFAGSSLPSNGVLEIVRPLLLETSSSGLTDDKVVHRAWSTLLSFVKGRRDLSIDVLNDIHQIIPGAHFGAATATPIMQAFTRLGDARKAIEIWQELVEQQAASPGRPGFYVDREALAVATEACYLTSGLESAVYLVDHFARRPGSGSDAELSAVQLDATNVNVLLKCCQRQGRFALAERLWYTAGPRWGVYLDSTSLVYLLGAGTGGTLGIAGQAELDSESTRYDRDDHDYRRAEGDSPALSFNEPFRDNAHMFDYGGSARDLDPWKTKRAIFQDVLFQNWPSLRGVKSPLELDAGRFGFLSSLFGFHSANSSPSPSATLHPDEAGLSGSISPSSSNSDSNSNSNSKSTLHRAPAPLASLPNMTSQYTHLVPDAHAFHAYITLLAEAGQPSQIPLVLGWMRHLRCLPLHASLLVALMHATEGGGQLRHVSGWHQDGSGAFVSDEQVLMRWLENWLGDATEPVRSKAGKPQRDGNGKVQWRKRVPTEMDVAMYTRRQLEKRHRRAILQRKYGHGR